MSERILNAAGAARLSWRSGVAGLCLCGLTAAGSGARAGERVQCRIEADRNVLPADTTQVAVLKVCLEAPPVHVRERPAVNLAIVLDRSGSMSGEKLERAKDAAIEVLRRLESRDVFALVTYDHAVETVVAARRVGDMEGVESRIRQVEAGGNTALFGGVSQGASEVRKHLTDRYVHRIILLSDGLANVGPSSPDELGRLGAALIKEGISVTTVGVGNDYNEDLMTQLSQKSDGNAYFVQSSGDLPRIFAAELGDVLSVAAKKVRLLIDCEEGVVPLAVIGREGRVTADGIELALNQLYGGQQKYVLIKVEVPATPPGQRRAIARARLVYEDALANTREETAAEAVLRFSADPEEVARSGNEAVRRDFLLNLNALAQDRAIVLAEEGELGQAVDELRASARQLREAARDLKDSALATRADEMERELGRLEREGLTQDWRKRARTESYQERNQQMNR